MGNAVQIVLTLLLLMAAGYFLAARGILNEKASKFLSKLVLWIGVPASTVNNMFTSFRADMLQNAGMGILAPFASNLLAFLAAVAVGRLLRVKKGRRGIFYLMFAFSNTIFIGLPVCQALFGDASIPYALFYYMGNTTLVWTIGIYFVQKDNPAQAGGKFSILGTLKKVLSPGIVSFAVSLALVLLAVAALWVLCSNQLILTAIHPQLASSRGVKTARNETLFTVVIAVVVTLAMSWVGLMVINSLLVLPAASARNVAKNVRQYHLFSVLGALLASVAGLILAYYLGCSAGATIALLLALFFAVTFALRRTRA